MNHYPCKAGSVIRRSLASALLIVASCGGIDPSIDAYYSTDQDVLQAAFSQGEFDHVVLDTEGSYFCVLRRPDDLAGLRAQFINR